jgi:hypothetical protein
MDDEAIITAVAARLKMPPRAVQVAIDHDNNMYDRHPKTGVQAYGKLAGYGWTYYVKDMSVIIGRPPEGTAPPSLDDEKNDTDELQGTQQERPRIHIDLGPTKLVSRQHAELYYEHDEELWRLLINGRNGVRINNIHYWKPDKRELRSGDVIEIAGVQMIVIFPDKKLEIDPSFLRKAELIAPDPSELDPNTRRSQGGLRAESSHTQAPSSQPPPAAAPAPTMHQGDGAASAPIPLAPAPPNYRRSETPPSARGKGASPRSKRSPIYNRGLNLESTEEIDYSLDSAKEIKPPYSYARMIGEAIINSEGRCLTLNNIYKSISDRYSFYRHSEGGWQVRALQMPCHFWSLLIKAYLRIRYGIICR